VIVLTGGSRRIKIAASEDHMTGGNDDVTGLLHAWGGGDLAARDELIGIVHQELRRRAAARLRREQRGHLLQPTALVNEAYLRLVDQRHTVWQNRAHFFALASEMMRRILVDHARRRKVAKRSGRWARVTLDDCGAQYDPPEVDVLDLDAALSELAAIDPRKSRVAELRFFGGLSHTDVACSLGISLATVERDWQMARAWLYRRLTPAPDTHDS
jgi:RNA polymerase sigma-70 factor (ECF subfamily)